ncbi:hypothetical protein [Saccharomonospora cyanea]|uniref:DUF2188 domain-containing protein n=1 Tax=Saccharomonospora cyanea NA-134 TaxID=882082 RepID=H5XGX0_9PSEU|nr:hypothetical protein [Saccharomonospora cyanea]EHR62697.1 hypothetical protein SaccyDRAFT_3872 [Saccharomonospora cyanea NA-134]
MQTITAKYVQRDEDWTVTVSGLGKTLNGEASGIIAARDRADQLVEQLAGEGTPPTVVHLLNGSAYEFTSTYMTARLTRGPESPEAPADDERPAETQDAAQQGDEESTKPSATTTVPRKELGRDPRSTEHRYAHAG